jgi:cell shape-determining protein MreC
MSGWEIAVIISSIINTTVIVILIVLLCILVGVLIKVSRKLEDIASKGQNVADKVESYVLKPAKFFKHAKIDSLIKLFTSKKPKIKIDVEDVEIVDEEEE